MRNILLSAVALSALAIGSASAADLPRRQAAAAPVPVYAAPIFTWTGFYVGGEVGGAWVNDNGRAFAPGFIGSIPYGTATGVTGGLFAGFNYQFAGPIVIGIEADIEATSINTNVSTFCAVPGGCGAGGPFKETMPWQGSVRGRLGYAAGPALFYVTGGLAVAQFNTNYGVGPGSTSFSGTNAGWTVGGGIEYAFNANWTARVEYRYSQFNFTDTPAAVGVSVKHQPSENAVRVGIAYKFGAPASAVVAKY
jgi:outer membrane immunogenic protein